MHTSVEIYLNKGDVADMIDVWLFFASALLAFMKHKYLHDNQERIAQNIKSYMQDWKNEKSEKSLKIMKTHSMVRIKLHLILYHNFYNSSSNIILRKILL